MSTPETISAYVQLAMLIGLAVLTFLNTVRAKRIEKVAQETHHLVNSGMAHQLFIGMVAAESLAIAKASKENKELAKTARTKYEEHMNRQAEADAVEANKPA